MRRFDSAVQGAASTVHKFNRLVAGIKELNTFVGDGLILVNRTATGYTLSLNMPALLSRIPKVGGSGGINWEDGLTVKDQSIVSGIIKPEAFFKD